ncbi:surface lipoprotein assembly modifier, partial [Pseudomonas marginalis]
EQDSAQGVFLRTELSYQKNIHPAHVWLNQLSINHKQYVNEPQYNELSTQIYSRYQYQQPRYQLHIGPKIYYENSGITGHNYGVGIRWGGIWQPSQASQWLLIA